MHDKLEEKSDHPDDIDALRRKIAELTEQLQQKTRALEHLEAHGTEDHYRQLFHHSTHMMMLQDIETGAIIDANAETTRVSGYSLEKLRESGIAGFSPKGPGFEPERAMGFISKAAAGDPQLFEWGFVDKRGELHPTEVHLKRVEINGIHWLLSTARDITKRKQMEEDKQRLEKRIQQAQKLESLGVLAGGIAHDFNNLLAGIMGNADLALIKLPPDAPCRRYLENVEKTAQRATELTNQMLAYSGKGGFIIQPFSLSKTIKEIGHLLEAVVSKKATLEYHFASVLPQVEGDVSQIRQVLMNLINNASDAIDQETGVITVKTGVEEIDTAQMEDTFLDWGLVPGPYVFVEVSDTGCGMSEDTQKKIFDPFFTTKFTGRGLGLAAALGIVRGHKGAIHVQSEVGRGTAIRFLLPAISKAEKPQIIGRAPAESWTGAGLVLLVDDETFVRDMATEILETIGFDVVSAADGYEAIELFKEQRDECCLVVLDMTMPRMNGAETYSEIRRIRSDVPVLLSSGYNEQEAQKRFADEGLSGFIQKPYSLRTMASVLRGIFDE